MHVLRTPDDRFANLPDYPFEPNYFDVAAGLRLHYLDEGPRDAPPVLLMHGEPTWSFLYRRFIPPLVAAGRRVLAPDLVGFGKSDKPTARDDYSYERHVEWMLTWLRAVDLTGITLFCQDWGGLIGLRLVAADPSRFAAVVVANTALPTGEAPGPAFAQWLEFSQTVPEMPIGVIVQNGSGHALSHAEVAAYDAPFPDERYKAGARAFPALVPITPEHPSVAENRAAWETLARFDRPFFTAFGAEDMVTGASEFLFRARIPGARGQAHRLIPGGHHFVQEHAPAALVSAILEATGACPRRSSASR